MFSQLNYKHLHYFWAVARAGSVTAAARQLGMSAQTVSGQISRLEQQIGRALFSQQGRGLVLTEAGRLALSYADRIFQLGEELQEMLADEQLDHTLRLSSGISDVLPKSIAYRLLKPALSLPQRLRLHCNEGAFDQLLHELASHSLDLVLADRPAPAAGQQTMQSHLLARCPVMIFATPELVARYRDGFPHSLQRAPLLLPSRDNVLRSQLEHWLDEQGIRAELVGEFKDGALLQTFGEQGVGLFPAPAFAVEDITAGGKLGLLGRVAGVEEHYYAITNRRKLQHKAVQAIILQAEAEAS
ncbi:transcriptional regulator, LysR family [Aquitalea magnusonii]|uniref:Transcriptional regulator, LysR family n=1 Tax=Aquitalea magnusonii TaxID=332411 RepID=A0A3G9GGI9_9NEIS|nr:transcriptional activator NhaR [Aquitalea magnusonii]BBF84636.1 transcriptional regulator, LysR family [Aquitalea magnusonii]